MGFLENVILPNQTKPTLNTSKSKFLNSVILPPKNYVEPAKTLPSGGMEFKTLPNAKLIPDNFIPVGQEIKTPFLPTGVVVPSGGGVGAGYSALKSLIEFPEKGLRSLTEFGGITKQKELKQWRVPSYSETAGKNVGQLIDEGMPPTAAVILGSAQVGGEFANDALIFQGIFGRAVSGLATKVATDEASVLAYDFLGRPKTLAEAEKSFKVIQKEFHPDISGSDVMSKQANNAIEVLRKNGVPNQNIIKRGLDTLLNKPFSFTKKVPPTPKISGFLDSVILPKEPVKPPVKAPTTPKTAPETTIVPKGISKEDRIKGQPIKIYHSTNITNKDVILREGFKRGSELPEDAFRGGGHGEMQNSISFSDNVKDASRFGISQKNTLIEAELKPNSKIISRTDIEYAEELNDEIPKLLNDGVDAVRLPNTGEGEIVVINPKAISKITDTFDYRGIDAKNLDKLFKSKSLTPSQLSSLYDEAVKGKVTEVKPEVVKVPGEQLPVKTTGELQISRLEARQKEILDRITPEQAKEQGISTFEQMNKKEQITKATDYVLKNPDEALQVVKGELPPPKDLLNNSIALALETQAELTGNAELVSKLASLRSTRFGQEISILTEADPLNVVSQTRSIKIARENAIIKKTGKTISKAKADVETEIDKIIKEERTLAQIKVAEAIKLLDKLKIC